MIAESCRKLFALCLVPDSKIKATRVFLGRLWAVPQVLVYWYTIKSRTVDREGL